MKHGGTPYDFLIESIMFMDYTRTHAELQRHGGNSHMHKGQIG